MTHSRHDPLESVIETAIDECKGGDLTVDEMLRLFGDRSFGPVITLLGLLVVVPPIGAIPGLPIIVAMVILLFSLQIVFGADHIWLPGFIAKQSISCDKLEEAEDRVKPWLARIDRLVTGRLKWATGKTATYLAAIAVSLLALIMIPLELVPFAVAAPGVATVLFGLALVARDGALMLAAGAVTLAAIALAFFMVPWGQFAGWFG